MPDADPAPAGAGAPGGGAPAAPPAPAPSAPAAPPPPAAAQPQQPPGQPKPALNRKERAILRKHFGIKIGKSDDLAERGAKFREKQEGRKKELDDLREKAPALEQKLAHAHSLLKVHAEQAIETLPEAMRATVKATAGDDPVKLLEAVTLARATLAAAPPPTTPPGKPPVAPPASTSAAGGAPPPASTAAPNHRAVYEKLRNDNPMAAAAYAQRHEREVFGDGAAT